ncbi:hypothetical protein [Mycolicibacter terrae]|uniref:hypothetical protein n=1 Tax=Mycolicibacter terrae TaxID=1788 RepID=UPI003558B7E9
MLSVDERPDLAYEPSNCRAICKRCHASITGKQGRAKQLGTNRKRPPRLHPSQCDPDTGEQYR